MLGAPSAFLTIELFIRLLRFKQTLLGGILVLIYWLKQYSHEYHTAGLPAAHLAFFQHPDKLGAKKELTRRSLPPQETHL